MTDERTKRAITYGFLAQAKSTKVFQNSILDLFVPLVKKGMSRHCILTNGAGGENIDEVGKIITEEYAINIPHSVLRVLMQRVEEEVGDEDMFKLHQDDSFLLKSFFFSEFEAELQQVKEDVEMIQGMYEQFCNTFDYDLRIIPSVTEFIDENRLALSSYITNEDNKLAKNFTPAAQFVDFCRQIPYVYRLLCNQYLGSVITCYLEFKPKKAEMGVDLLLDTNFIISLLDLNTASSTETCTRLLEISKSIGYTHHVLMDTIEEAQSLLYVKSRHFDSSVVYKYINKEDIYSACERRKLNSADLERIADNLVKELQERGINIVYNTDNLTGKAKFSPEYEILKSKRNTPKAALHDAKAIYYVKEKRTKTITEFELVNCWFVNNAITHDNDSESIEALLDKERRNGLPDIIRADNLLNILWLSNPQVDANFTTGDLGDIGLTSLVTMTLNKSLPKARIIRTLDENIQKYRTEEVSERDVLLLSTRIVNHHLSSEEVEELNKKAQQDRQEFSRRIKEEAAKEEAIQKQRGERIDKVVTKWQIDLKKLLKGRLEVLKTVKGENQTLLDDNKQKDEEIRRQKAVRLRKENEWRKEKREKFILEALRKWRKWPTIWLRIVLFFFLLGVAWLVLSLLFVPEGQETELWMKIIGSKLFSILFTILMALIGYFVFKTYHDRKFLNTNINSFIDHLDIPEAMKELKSVDDLDE
jgi:hypothetical protein